MSANAVGKAKSIIAETSTFDILDSSNDPEKDDHNLDNGTVEPFDALAGAVATSKGDGDSDNDLDLYGRTEIDPVYRAKAHLLNKALAEIGMGKYQWWLFVAAGFGWFSDSIWPLVGGLILSPVVNEFHVSAPFLSLALNIGLLVGAAFWGLGCDIVGRRWAFNITLFISGVFAIAAGGSPNFVTLASLFAVVGVGAGGNMPVDSAVFLEFIPGTHQYLLTVLSIWWAAGQLLAAFVAWPLIASFSCEGANVCLVSMNHGWRYLLFTLGGLMLVMWCVRVFAFRLFESPRYLVARGKDEEAVEVLHAIARINGAPCSITVEHLRQAKASAVAYSKLSEIKKRNGKGVTGAAEKSIRETWLHIKALFATPRMAWSTSLLVLLWGLIGLASTLYNSFLPFLLASKGAVFGDGSVNITYRNTLILSLTGIPGALLAGWAVELPFIGRRGTLMISCCATAIFLFATTTARTSNALLGWNCGYSLFSNIMYGVLYAVSPEIFPAKDRGTGNGLTSIATRVFGVLAPIIALFANVSTSVPVYISGALIIVSGFLALLLPFEPRGKASL
ncbi:MFS general substrate transporter [Phellopilus nigrolimitatus]|nr:MFS general substrate transporter [Phellopilus nigrolimitatus]